MNPFPEEWELLALFESEPTITDRDVPWFYNRLNFETKRGSDEVRCDIEPGCEILEINWWHDGKERLKLELNWVAGLRVVTGGGKDYLIASFRDQYLYDLEFHLKPEICLRWATSAECPPKG
jgi:hypothetical protein